MLAVLQSTELQPGETFCNLACPIGCDPIHPLGIDPDRAGLTMAARADDGPCSLPSGPTGPQRAGYLGTVPSVPDHEPVAR